MEDNFTQSHWTPQTPYCIYKHTSPSGYVYIGQTKKKRLHDRWINGAGYTTCTIFYRAIQKYGWDNIKHEILFEGLTKTEANRIEIEQIAYYKERGISYNITNGGEGCLVPYTDKRKAKLSKSQKGRKYLHKGNVEIRIPIDDLQTYLNNGWDIGRSNRFKKQCVEVLKKHGHPLKGRKQSDEHRLKNKMSHLGQIPTEYARKRCSEVCRGRISPTFKKVVIHKGNMRKFIIPEQLNDYLNDGWLLGTGNHVATTKNKIRITNGIVNKMVDPNEFDYYIREGWSKGELPRKKYRKRT